MYAPLGRSTSCALRPAGSRVTPSLCWGVRAIAFATNAVADVSGKKRTRFVPLVDAGTRVVCTELPCSPTSCSPPSPAAAPNENKPERKPLTDGEEAEPAEAPTIPCAAEPEARVVEDAPTFGFAANMASRRSIWPRSTASASFRCRARSRRRCRLFHTVMTSTRFSARGRAVQTASTKSTKRGIAAIGSECSLCVRRRTFAGRLLVLLRFAPRCSRVGRATFFALAAAVKAGAPATSDVVLPGSAAAVAAGCSAEDADSSPRPPRPPASSAR
mmetsp:Transcript_15674/g.38821  ORF Transcript_15674/g.38821 Transcript_15674/m.38821 type:complete len:273 (-) Transcript_15674:1692-2510(-)